MPLSCSLPSILWSSGWTNIPTNIGVLGCIKLGVGLFYSLSNGHERSNHWSNRPKIVKRKTSKVHFAVMEVLKIEPATYRRMSEHVLSKPNMIRAWYQSIWRTTLTPIWWAWFGQDINKILVNFDQYSIAQGLSDVQRSIIQWFEYLIVLWFRGLQLCKSGTKEASSEAMAVANKFSWFFLFLGTKDFNRSEATGANLLHHLSPVEGDACRYHV